MKRHLLAAACALLAGNTLAADPTASLNRNWTAYTGAGPIGNNNVNDNDNAFWLYESSGTWLGQAVTSWFVFWDPKRLSGLDGTVTFDRNIVFVHDDQAELQATASFGKAGVTYDYSNQLIGLEASDSDIASPAGKTLTARWSASSPGDHVRVMTAVPEPSTYAMFGAGILAMGFMARRRRSD